MWISFFDHLGTVAFAYSGFLAGARKGLDVLGLTVVAFLTATAGGATSQVLMNQPPAILTDWVAVTLVFATCFVADLLYRFGLPLFEKRTGFVIADALGLSAFALLGAHFALDHGLPLFGTSVIAFLSAVGGGIIRDSLLGDIPMALRSDFYGIVAVIVGGLVYAAHHSGFEHRLVYLGIFVFGVLLRLTAWHRGWSLPALPDRSDKT